MTTIQLAFFLCALSLAIGLFMPSFWCLLLAAGIACALWQQDRNHRGPRA